MTEAWLTLLGLLLAGYFVLGGYDYGVQMLTPVLGRDERTRRGALGAVGPFFLGNEVWLVAFVGVLFGAFPFLEGTLLAGMFGLFVALLLGLVLGNAAVQLRSRFSAAPSRRGWDVLVAAGGLVPAVVWGVFTGVLLRGVPLRPDGYFTLTWSAVLNPFVLLCAATAVALFLTHGATFLALRSSGGLAARATRTASTTLVVTAVGIVATAVVGVVGGAAVTNPVTALLVAGIAVLALVVSAVALRAGRSGVAFAGTGVAAAAPVAAIGLSQYPNVLVSTVDPQLSLTAAAAAADPVTLAMLSVFGVLLFPAILAYQAWSWWIFRGRVDGTVPAYY